MANKMDWLGQQGEVDMDLPPALSQCAPQVSPVLMQALVRTESAWNPYAIGPDSGQSAISQPRSLETAIATVKQLTATGAKFSVGLAQIHMSNVKARGMTWEQAFDPCQNLKMGQAILFEFYNKAIKEGYTGVDAVWAALRGYNSGGVHNTVSDKYAAKIFGYMQEAINKPLQQKYQRRTPASTDTRFSQFASQVEIKSVQYKPQEMDMQVHVAKKHEQIAGNELREGESPDIFQIQEDTQGF